VASYKTKMLAHYKLLQEIFEKDLVKGAYAEGSTGIAIVYSIDK